MKPLVIVTSYKRLSYLKPCLESLRQDDVKICVVDGGSGFEMNRFLWDAAASGLIDHYIQMHSDNPGADVLKNVGWNTWAEPNSTFIITSDDLVYPKGYSKLLMDQYERLNSGSEKWTMVACSTGELITQYGDAPPDSPGCAYRDVNGVSIMEVGISMVSGAVMDTEAVRRVGGWPVYGKTGCGDVAISKRLRKLGFRLGYLRNPVADHLGRNKATDYPEYSAAFKVDEDHWYEEARRDEWEP